MKVDKGENLEKAARGALKQIKQKKYKQELLDRGITDIIELGISFLNKDVLVII